MIALGRRPPLEADGVSVEVVDLRSLRPLDRETICASVRKTSRAVILEEDWLTYGVGAEIAARSRKVPSTISMRRSAGSPPPKCPLPYAKPLELAALARRR